MPTHLLNHRLSLEGPPPPEDALWLAASITPPENAQVLDAMCGIGTVGLALLTRCPTVHVTGVDINPTLTTHTTHNAHTNGFQNNYTCHTSSLESYPTAVSHALMSYDLILMNPPYHAQTRGHQTPNKTKSQAYTLPEEKLTQWLKTLHLFLKPSFRVTDEDKSLARCSMAQAAKICLITHTACQAEILHFAQTHTYETHLHPLQTAASRPPKRLITHLVKSDTYTLTPHPTIQAYTPTLRKHILHDGQPLRQEGD